MEPRWSRSDTAVTAIGMTLAVVLTFPGYAMGNRVDPIVLGLPFSMFWMVLWIVVGAVALLLMYRRDPDSQGTASAGDDEKGGC